MTLRSRLILRAPIGMPVLAAMLFVPAGTWRHELAEQWKGGKKNCGVVTDETQMRANLR
jgi:hypothetical protein